MAAQATRFERVLACRGCVVSVRSPHGEALDWLGEFLGPWFDVPSAEPAATATRVGYAAAPGTYARWRRGARALDRTVECFTMDGGRDPWRIAIGTDGAQWAYDDRTAVAVAIRREESPRVDVLADADDRHARATLMRVVRELATTHAASRGDLSLHASAVADGDEVTLFAGPKRSGKSTLLLYALEQSGTRYVSNDRVFARCEAAGCRAHGVPTIVSLREGTPTLRNGLREELASGAWHYPHTVRTARAQRAAGTMVLTESTARVPGLSPAQLVALLDRKVLRDGRLARIVLPTVDPALAARGFELRPVPGERAAERVLAGGLLAAGRVEPFLALAALPDRPAIAGSVERLCRSVPCFSLALGPTAYDDARLWDALRSAPRQAQRPDTSSSQRPAEAPSLSRA